MRRVLMNGTRIERACAEREVIGRSIETDLGCRPYLATLETYEQHQRLDLIRLLSADSRSLAFEAKRIANFRGETPSETCEDYNAFDPLSQPRPQYGSPTTTRRRIQLQAHASARRAMLFVIHSRFMDYPQRVRSRE